MEALKVLGTEKIGKIEFTGIEGGFGKGKKAMLVKDIALIHGKEVKEINRLINNNIRRFKNGIDLLDLKQVISNHLFSDYGFTKAQWGNANHIYLLSERGYAKLLKILDDDKAWDIYDELVDNYFNMRAVIETQNELAVPKTFAEALRLAADQAEQLEKQKPKVEYFDSQMKNPGLMTATEIAKGYGWSAEALNRELKKRHVIFKQGDHWVLYQEYAGKGYAQYEPFPYIKDNGQRGVTNNLKWTQRGKKFIYDLLAEDGIYPTTEQMNLLEK